MLDFESVTTISAVSILLGGLSIGIKHAFDADHLAAVSTIVSQRKNLLSSLLIGGVWGIGHTASLLFAGICVILLNIRIEGYGKTLEFFVALMLIGLGANVLYKLARGGRLHYHVHSHGPYTHIHPHIHENKPEPDPNSHHGLRLSIRPLIIGMVHGLAGSAALMLYVLSQIQSTALAFGYIIVFGVGSIGGMMMMSMALSLPARFTAKHFKRTHLAVQAAAGLFSIGIGLLLAYNLGFKEGLLR
jgi:ABC-type nickel/cobalt efflux system permease component RcnA